MEFLSLNACHKSMRLWGLKDNKAVCLYSGYLQEIKTGFNRIKIQKNNNRREEKKQAKNRSKSKNPEHGARLPGCPPTANRTTSNRLPLSVSITPPLSKIVLRGEERGLFWQCGSRTSLLLFLTRTVWKAVRWGYCTKATVTAHKIWTQQCS